MGLKENIEQLNRLTREAEAGGGEERLKKQHAQGRMTARERVEFLLDRGSFVELDKFKTHRITDFDMAERKIPGDGVVTGYGTIDGRQVCVFSHDFTVFGGSLSGAFAEKVCNSELRSITSNNSSVDASIARFNKFSPAWFITQISLSCLLPIWALQYIPSRSL